MTGSDPRDPKHPQSPKSTSSDGLDYPAEHSDDPNPLTDQQRLDADRSLRELDDELDAARPTSARRDAGGEVPEEEDIDPSDYVDEAPATSPSSGAAVAPEVPTPPTSRREPEAPTPPPPTRTQPAPRRGGGAALALSLLALLGVIALGAAGWYFQQRETAALRAELEQRLEGVQSAVRATVSEDLQATQAQVSQGMDSLQATRTELDQQLEAIRRAADPRPLLKPFEERVGRAETQVATATARVDDLGNQQRQALDQMNQRLNGQQQRLLSLSTTNREDWLLAEAEYLLRLANQRVLIERSPATAAALLESADGVLEEAGAGLGDPELFAIRKAVSADIAALQLVPTPDRDGLYLRLQALADQAAQLPTVPAHDLSPPRESGEPTQGDTWWRRGLSELKGLAGVFDQYIRVQDTEAPQKPLLDQATAQVAALNIRLLLEQAQVALLRQEATIYRESLTQAEALARHYFLAGEQVDRFGAALNELASVEIAPPLPDISDAVELLHGYIQLLHKSEGDA